MAPRTNIENRPQMTSELYTRGSDFWQKLFWIWTVQSLDFRLDGK